MMMQVGVIARKMLLANSDAGAINSRPAEWESPGRGEARCVPVY